jgi:hypothetical protein
MSRLDFALANLRFSRGYTQILLDSVPDEDWFRMPAGAVTHVAWQAGHLAWVQYRLALERIRGLRPEDELLIPAAYQELFGKGTQPQADAAGYPSLADIRGTFDRVHEQVLRETPALSDAVLDQPVDPPHPVYKDKYGALLWSARHELIHAGQIGLLRRLLGYKPLR